MKKVKGLAIFTLCCPLMIINDSAVSWSGYDYEKGSYVDIERGNLVRSGRDIEIFDYKEGEYRDVEVQSINRRGGSVEVEVYDWRSGEYRTIEMDD